ncbi:MAG: O-antigen ligase family protein [Bacteroidaceae bacterium]|nr:O-antigen ligase family protein [Bacteroidaceae bacterium]
MNGFIFISIIQILFCILQATAILQSDNIYFNITGSNENPTTTSILIVGCIPFIIERMHQKRWYALFLPIVITLVFILRCRTAYIGLFVECSILLFFYLKEKQILIKISNWHKIIIASVAFIFFILISFKLYDIKRNSANGRILIWKLSSEMIIENPMGYGYGLFEKNYNLKQVNYFKKEIYNDIEQKNAGYIFMPYNDFLEHGVEGGIIGLFFFAGFYLMLIKIAIKTKIRTEFSIIFAFFIMSFFNFIYTSIQGWLVIICISSLITFKGEKVCCFNNIQKQKLFLFLVTIIVFFSFIKVLKITYAQLVLNKLINNSKNHEKLDDILFKSLEEKISTSELYWSKRAELNIKHNKYENALTYIHNARKYSSSPKLFIYEYVCLNNINKNRSSIKYIDTLTNMIPSKLTYKYLLLKHYESNDKEKATYYANEILKTGIKVESEKANYIINQAKTYLKSNE